MTTRTVSLFKRAVGAARRRGKGGLNRARVFWRTERLHGLARVDLAPDECGLVTMVKDAGYFIEELLRHHTELGVKHILVIDNGSQDNTIEIARRHTNVTVLRNTLPPREYESQLRADLARRVYRGGWLLFVDSDELFTTPGEGPQALRHLCTYCNEHNFTAVVCQVLDMFSDRPLSDTAGTPYAEALRLFTRYSLDYIESRPFHDPEIEFSWFLQQSRCTSPDVKILFGGIRKQHFGENCCLTTQRLVRNLPKVKIYTHPHCSSNVDCADVTALIRHYKFCGDILSRETEQVRQNVWGHGEDLARVSRLSATRNYVIDCQNAHSYVGVKELIDQGFLVCPWEYKEWR